MKAMSTRMGTFLWAAFLLLSPFIAGGCTLDIIVDKGDDGLSVAIEQIADGVIEIIEHFD